MGWRRERSCPNAAALSATQALRRAWPNFLFNLSGCFLSALRIARADDDVMAGFGPALGQRPAEIAAAAENREPHQRAVPGRNADRSIPQKRIRPSHLLDSRYSGCSA